MDELIKDYRLDYPNSDYPAALKNKQGYGVIRFKNTDKTVLDYATGTNGDVPPNTRAGMLGNKTRIIFEYKLTANRDLANGDILEIYDTDGIQKAIYDYSENLKGWKKR